MFSMLLSAVLLIGFPASAQVIEKPDLKRGKIHYDASEYVDPKVVIRGDIAVLTYNYHSLHKDTAGQMQRSSFWNTTEVYRMIAGSWKIIHTHWSLIKGKRIGGGV